MLKQRNQIKDLTHQKSCEKDQLMQKVNLLGQISV